MFWALYTVSICLKETRFRLVALLPSTGPSENLLGCSCRWNWSPEIGTSVFWTRGCHVCCVGCVCLWACVRVCVSFHHNSALCSLWCDDLHKALQSGLFLSWRIFAGIIWKYFCQLLNHSMPNAFHPPVMRAFIVIINWKPPNPGQRP
jgi:hypothetical protein